MSPDSATTLILDCGSMVGHKQSELELPSEVVPFFGVIKTGSHSIYLSMLLSNGQSEFVRLIYRKDNGMWRVEFTAAVPEIGSLIPAGTRRSNHAAIFEKVGSEDTAQYKLSFAEVDSSEYKGILNKTAVQHRTRSGSDGRNYGWT